MTWSAVVPFYNEELYIGSTVASLLTQKRPLDRLVLVDNGSGDDSVRACREAVARSEAATEVSVLDEPRPGQGHALRRGIEAVETEYVAVCDADTVYPPGYVRMADNLFRRHEPQAVAVMAVGLQSGPRRWPDRLKCYKVYLMSRLLAGQCHTGGYAMCFKTAALRDAGGYDPARWPYVLKDQELVHRMLKQGTIRYCPDHWCRASDRRSDRRHVRWTLSERLLYHFTPFRSKDWFFYEFLAGRLAGRGMEETVLRQRAWEKRQ